MVFMCERCFRRFSSMRELVYHNHFAQARRWKLALDELDRISDLTSRMTQEEFQKWLDGV